MAAGDAIFRLLLLQTDAGAADSYANKAAFQAAGWDLTFEDATGAAISPVPTWTLADEGSGLHRVNLDEPTGRWYAKITIPAGHYTPSVALSGDGDAYDAGDVIAAVQAGLGVGALTTNGVLTGQLDDWIQGDSYAHLDLVVPAWALSKVGASAIDEGGVSLLAAAKQPFPTKLAADTEQIVFTVTVADAGNRLIDLTAAWDAGYVLGSAESRDYTVDLSIKKGSLQVTFAQYALRLLWQADTR